MKLPEDIDISTILQFDQNHELTFKHRYPPSRELEESLDIQDTIDENWMILEKRYNEYAFARNEYYTQESTETLRRVEDVSQLARITLHYSGLAGEEVSTAGEYLLTRVIFSEMVNALHNELPTMHTFEETSYVDFARITREAEMEYMLTEYQDDDGEY
jgi:hypothetical protein